PASGSIVPSSAKQTALSSVYTPPASQTMRTMDGVGSWPATRPGVRRMPTPSVLPTITARPKPRPSTRRRWRGALRLEGNEHHVDRVTDVARRMAGAARLELDV